jgi:hypothetical protein
MKKYLLTTFSHPVKGKESEYNLWYDQVHIHDLLKVPEINSAQRFRPLTNPVLPESPFLAIYEIETDNIPEVMQAIQNGTYTMQPSDAIDPSSVTVQVYEVIGEKQFS